MWLDYAISLHDLIELVVVIPTIPGSSKSKLWCESSWVLGHALVLPLEWSGQAGPTCSDWSGLGFG
jgi:hypothetical protein